MYSGWLCTFDFKNWHGKWRTSAIVSTLKIFLKNYTLRQNRSSYLPLGWSVSSSDKEPVDALASTPFQKDALKIGKSMSIKFVEI